MAPGLLHAPDGVALGGGGCWSALLYFGDRFDTIFLCISDSTSNVFGGCRRRGRFLWRAAWAVICIGLFGVLAYSAFSIAMRQGEISVISPFRYTRLIFAMSLGVLAFGERPDAMTLLGSTVIITRGIFTLIRSRSA